MSAMWVTTSSGQRPSRRVAAYLLLSFFAAGGGGLLLAGVTSVPTPRPPQPAPQAAAAGYGAGGAGAAHTLVGQVAPGPDVRPPPPLPHSAPVRVRIPAIDVDADLMTLGVARDGGVEVPPLARAEDAGWYEHGAAPGERGNAVIIGHVDSRERGPAVFFHLGSLRPGDRIEVLRADRERAEFQVDGVASYPKSDFPTDLVYGPSPLPGLRLVTCGGEFDDDTRDYRDNVVVFATLTAD